MATFRAKDCSNPPPLTNRSIDLLFPVSTNHVNVLADDSDAGLRDWKGLEGEDWSKIEEYEGKFVRRD